MLSLCKESIGSICSHYSVRFSDITNLGFLGQNATKGSNGGRDSGVYATAGEG